MTTQTQEPVQETLDAPAPESVAPAGNAEDLSWAPDDDQLASLHEPFDSNWQVPEDIEAGYTSFFAYYQANVLPHLPADKATPILCVSCGPGYLVNLLKERGYTDVTGIDSDADKVAHGQKRGLNCIAAQCFAFMKAATPEQYGAIVLEQELNHLTHPESIAFLKLCHRALRPGGTIYGYGLNGANPIVGAENLAHNIDHFSTYGEHSLKQVLHAQRLPRPAADAHEALRVLEEPAELRRAGGHRRARVRLPHFVQDLRQELQDLYQEDRRGRQEVKPPIPHTSAHSAARSGSPRPCASSQSTTNTRPSAAAAV